jgi:hypothetical protein
VPGEIPCTNAPHLYRVQPRPGANVASPSDVAGGHLYRVEVPPVQMRVLIVFMFLFSNVFA